MPKRLTLAAILAVLCLGAVLLHAGRPDRSADQFYERANRSFGNGDYGSALAQYDDFIAQFPTSPKVPDALYQMGFVYANQVRQPERALKVYRQIADDYPKHPLADDALRHVADLLVEDGDYDGAIRTCQEIVDEFGEENKPLAAQAEKRIADALFRSGNGPSTRRQCERILRCYPDQRLTCAESLALMAEVTIKLDSPPDYAEAYERYSQLLTDYPDSHLAEEAKRNTAWLENELAHSGQPPSDRADKADGRKPTVEGGLTLVPLPKTASQGERFEDAGLLDAARVVLAYKGTELSRPKLAGWSGEAFAFYYSSGDRRDGADVCDEHPLVLLGRGLGFEDCQLLEERSADNAWARAQQYLDRGEPVITPMAAFSPPDWGIIMGYDRTSDEVLVYTSSADRRSYSRSKFLSIWGSDLCPSPRLRGKSRMGGYPMVVLGSRTKSFSAAVLVQSALRRAVDVAERGEQGGYRCGAAAFAELADDMRRVGTNELTEHDLDELEGWCGRGLSKLIESRRDAARFLRMWTSLYSGKAQSALESAASVYDEEVRTLGLLRDAFKAARADVGGNEKASRPERIVEAAARLEQTAVSRIREAL